MHDGARRLLEEILDYRGVPRRRRAPDFDTPLSPVLPIRFRRGSRAFNFFSTVTGLATPQDITF